MKNLLCRLGLHAGMFTPQVMLGGGRACYKCGKVHE